MNVCVINLNPQKRVNFSFTRIFLFVVSLVCMLCGQAQSAFNFVQLCDTQLGFGGYEHDMRSFKSAVDQINDLNPDFVVICGDLVDDADTTSFTDFKKVINNLKVPYYAAPGNHDVGGKPTDASLNYYRQVIGDDYYTFTHKGYAFVVSNTQFWKVNLEGESDKHHEWFEATLKEQASKGIPSIVIGHYPLFLEDPEEEEKYANLPLAKRKEIMGILKDNGAVAFLSGHTHRRVINEYQEIMLVGGESTSKNFDDTPLGYRVWRLQADSIDHYFVALPDEFQHKPDAKK